MIRAAICTYNIEVGVVSLDAAIPCGRDRQYRILLYNNVGCRHLQLTATQTLLHPNFGQFFYLVCRYLERKKKFK